MNKSKSVMFVIMLFAFGLICTNAQAQQESRRLRDRQVSGILQRLEQSSNRFRNSLNLALVNGRIDETRPQNDINSFEPAFSSAVDQFTDRFNRRQVNQGDVQNLLNKALPVNGFMTRNRLSDPVQNHWAAVRTNLNALANAYGLSWQWNQQTVRPIHYSQSPP